MLSAPEDPIRSGETVMRFSMRNAKVETRYGGRFVNAIDGIALDRRAAGGGSTGSTT